MPYSLHLKIPAIISCLIIGITLAAPTHAQIDIIPASAVEDQTLLESGETHPPLKLTPDKSELIRLDKKAGSVIIGNPLHVSVLAENAKTLVLIPALPGATHVTVLDAETNVIMRRHVIVASPTERYVRVRKPCRGDDDSCTPTRVYFCPDMCHEINIAQEMSESDGSSGAAADAANKMTGQDGTNNTDASPTPQ